MASSADRFGPPRGPDGPEDGHRSRDPRAERRAARDARRGRAPLTAEELDREEGDRARERRAEEGRDAERRGQGSAEPGPGLEGRSVADHPGPEPETALRGAPPRADRRVAAEGQQEERVEPHGGSDRRADPAP